MLSFFKVPLCKFSYLLYVDLNLAANRSGSLSQPENTIS